MKLLFLDGRTDSWTKSGQFEFSGRKVQSLILYLIIPFNARRGENKSTSLQCERVAARKILRTSQISFFWYAHLAKIAKSIHIQSQNQTIIKIRDGSAPQGAVGVVPSKKNGTNSLRSVMEASSGNWCPKALHAILHAKPEQLIFYRSKKNLGFEVTFNT